MSGVAVLDLTGCKSTWEIHRRSKHAFHFPDYYGYNWDAFLDSFRTVGVPDKIVIRGEKGLPEDLRGSIEHLHSILSYIQEEVKEFDTMLTIEYAD